MPTLGQALFFLKADTRQFDSSMQASERQVTSSAATIGQQMAGMGASVKRAFEFAAGGFIVQGVQGITSALQGIGGGAYDAVASAERLKMSLQALVAQEEIRAGRASDMTKAMATAIPKAEELYNWTQKLAIQSPFSQEGVGQAFKMAKAYGFTSDEAQRLTQANIDFAAATGQGEDTMARIAMALGQIKAKGKLAGGEMLQLTEAGLGVRDILAPAFGVTTAELAKMQEKGLIPADKAINAIMESLEKDFGGAAARQSTTLSGLTASLQDLSSVSLRNALEGFFRGIQPLIAGLVDTLGSDAIQGRIKKMGDALGGVVAGGASRLLDVFGALNRVVGVIPRTSEELSKFVNKLREAGGQTRVDQYFALVNAFTAIKGAVGAVMPGLKDFASGLQTTFGGLGSFIQGALAGIVSGVQTALGPLKSFGNAIDFKGLASKFNDAMALFRAFAQLIAKDSFSWGVNIGQQLGGGIGRAAAFVVASLKALGAIIRTWLQPRSPPLIAPDLDKWGEGAANVYMAGWGSADMSIFKEMGGMVRSALEDMVGTGDLKQQDVIPTLLGSQEAIAAAVEEIRTTGQVSEEAFQRIVTAAGPAGSAVANVARAYLDYVSAGHEVAAAQEEVSSATEELTRLKEELAGIQETYNAKLEPFNEKLAGLRDQKEAIQDAERLKELQKTAIDGASTEVDKQLALLEIEEIQTKQAMDAITDEQGVAEEAKQAEIDAAQEGIKNAQAKLTVAEAAQQAASAQLDQQQMVIQATRDHNALLDEQKQLLESLAPKGGGGGGGAGAGGMPAMPAIPGMPTIPTPGEVAGGAKDMVVAEVSDAVEMAQGAAEAKLKEAEGALRERARALLSSISQGINDAIQNIPTLIQNVTTGITGALAALPELIATAGQGALDILAVVVPAGNDVRTKIGEVVVAVITAIGEYAPGIIGAVAMWGKALIEFAVTALPSIWSNMASIGSQVIGAIGAALPGIIDALAWWSLYLADFAVQALPGLLGNLGAAVGQLLDALGAALPGIVESLASWAGAFVEWVIAAAPPLFESLLGLVGQVLGWIGERAPIIATQLGTWALEFVAWAGPVLGKLILALGTMFGSVLIWIADQTPILVSTIAAWIPGFSAWVVTAIGELVIALAGVILEIATWAGTGAIQVGKDVLQVGTALADGIRKGITDKWEALKSWFMGLMKGLIGSGKEAIDAKSPSRASAKEIGEPFVLGIIQGIQNYADQLVNSVTTLTDRMLEAGAGLAEKLAALFKESVEATLGGTIDMRRQALDNFRQLTDLFAPLAPITEEEAANLVDATVQGKAWLKQRAELEKGQDQIVKELEKLDETAADINAEYGTLSEADLNAIIAPGSTSEPERQRRIAEFQAAREADRLRRLAGIEGERQELLAEQRDTAADMAVIDAARAAAMRAQVAELQKGNAAMVALGERYRNEFAQLEADVAALRETDAESAARLYDMRSAQLLELAKLETELAQETDAGKRGLLARQIAMTKDAQEAERAQMDYELAQAGDRYNELGDAVQELENAAKNSAMDTELERVRGEREKLKAERESINTERQRKETATKIEELEKKRQELMTGIANSQAEKARAVRGFEWGSGDEAQYKVMMGEMQSELERTVADLSLAEIDRDEQALDQREAALAQRDAASSMAGVSGRLGELIALLRDRLPTSSVTLNNGGGTSTISSDTYAELLRLLGAR